MKTTRLCLVRVALVACVSLPSWARAQSSSASLSEVQKAYADVDYERTRSLAAASIQRGGADRAAASELYLLWATAAAALDRADEARTAFSYAIAANPALKLDRNLSPKVRAPYLEARGAIASTDSRPPLEVTLLRHRQGLELELHDVLHVAANLVLSTRPVTGGPFARQRFEVSPRRRIATSQGLELQFFLQLLDRYGNALFELGSEDEPERLVQVTSSRPSSATPTTRAASPLPYYVTSGALAVLGIAAGGVATATYLRREDAAREWNSSACEQPGLTRTQQCGVVDERRRRSEYLSVGFASAGGALLVGSVISLLLAPSPTRPEVALDTGPGRLMLRLRTRL